MNIAETHIAGIIAPLQTARQTFVLRGLVLAALYTSLVLSAGLLLPPLLVDPSRLPTDWAYVVWLAGGLMLVVSLALVLRQVPSIEALARRADRLFDLGERLSACLNMPALNRGPAGAIAAGLMADAARHVQFVRPARLEPPVTRSVALAAAALIGLLVFAVISPVRLAGPQSAAIEAATLAALDVGQRAENLNTIADILREEAEKRQDTYLAAVAEAVRDLARNADRARDGAPFDKALEGLLEHARLAYGKNVPFWLRGNGAADDRYDLARDRNVVRLAEQAVGSKPVILPDGGAGEELIPELFTERDAARNASVVPMRPGEIRAAADLGDLKFQPQGVGRDASNGRANGEASQAGTGGAPPSPGKDDPGPVNIDGAAAMLAGGATQSGVGASRVAGQGTQDLNDPNQPVALEIARGTEQVLLPPDQYRQGRRIRMQMNPQVEVVEGIDATLPGFATARRAEPAPLARDTPLPRDQEIFARVFVHDDGAGGR